MPADAPALRPPDPFSSFGDSVLLVLGLEAAVLLASLLVVPVPVAEGVAVAVLDDVALAVLDDEVDDVSGELSGPNVSFPVLRSWPMMLKLALFGPASMPASVNLTLNQQGVADVKLRNTGTLEVKPDTF